MNGVTVRLVPNERDRFAVKVDRRPVLTFDEGRSLAYCNWRWRAVKRKDEKARQRADEERRARVARGIAYAVAVLFLVLAIFLGTYAERMGLGMAFTSLLFMWAIWVALPEARTLSLRVRTWWRGLPW